MIDHCDSLSIMPVSCKADRTRLELPHRATPLRTRDHWLKSENLLTSLEESGFRDRDLQRNKENKQWHRGRSQEAKGYSLRIPAPSPALQDSVRH